MTPYLRQVEPNPLRVPPSFFIKLPINKKQANIQKQPQYIRDSQLWCLEIVNYKLLVSGSNPTFGPRSTLNRDNSKFSWLNLLGCFSTASSLFSTLHASREGGKLG